MTRTLYKNLSGNEIKVDQIDSVCGEVASTINGALLIMRVFGENGDDDTIALCDAMTVLLKHIYRQVDGIQPDSLFTVPE